jgi:hypothetical protein
VIYVPSMSSYLSYYICIRLQKFGDSCYAGFFCLLSTHLSLLQIFSSGPHSHTLQSVTYRCPLRDRSSFTPLKGGEIQVIAAVQ